MQFIILFGNRKYKVSDMEESNQLLDGSVIFNLSLCLLWLCTWLMHPQRIIVSAMKWNLEVKWCCVMRCWSALEHTYEHRDLWIMLVGISAPQGPAIRSTVSSKCVHLDSKRTSLKRSLNSAVQRALELALPPKRTTINGSGSRGRSTLFTG